jgi:hypothetical protein
VKAFLINGTPLIEFALLASTKGWLASLNRLWMVEKQADD